MRPLEQGLSGGEAVFFRGRLARWGVPRLLVGQLVSDEAEERIRRVVRILRRINLVTFLLASPKARHRYHTMYEHYGKKLTANWLTG